MARIFTAITEGFYADFPRGEDGVVKSTRGSTLNPGLVPVPGRDAAFRGAELLSSMLSDLKFYEAAIEQGRQHSVTGRVGLVQERPRHLSSVQHISACAPVLLAVTLPVTESLLMDTLDLLG